MPVTKFPTDRKGFSQQDFLVELLWFSRMGNYAKLNGYNFDDMAVYYIISNGKSPCN